MKTFVVLELMNHMVLVAQEAKRRGHQVVVCNRDALQTSGPFTVPEGLVDAVFPVESWSDAGAVDRLLLDIERRYEVVGTYAAFEATLPYEAKLRELAGLPNNGAVNVDNVLNKASVRRKLNAEGLSKLRVVSLPEALRWRRWSFPGPAVLKPAYGTGSALCFVVSSLDELHRAAKLADEAEVINPLMKEYILSHRDFILEEKAEGELLSVESLVSQGNVCTVGLTGRYVLAANPVVEMGLFFPYEHPRRDEIVATAEALHRSLGIFQGATHLELMVPDEGPVELIDFNIRMAGIGSMVLFSEAFGIRYAAPVTDLACGLDPDTSFLGRPPRYAAEIFVLPPPGTTKLRHIAFPPGTLCRRVPKPPGQKLSGRADQLDHVGMFVVTGEAASEVHERALHARRETEVNGARLGDNVNNVVRYSRFIGRDNQLSTTS